MKELGWEAYRLDDPLKPLLYRIPLRPLRELSRQLLDAFGLRGLRLVGDPETVVSTVFLCEHVFGDERDRETILRAAVCGGDLLVAFEIVDWTLSACVRDAAQLGMPRAILEMGHFNTEELGMKHIARWLPALLGEPIPVRYLPSGDSFSYILAEKEG